MREHGIEGVRNGKTQHTTIPDLTPVPAPDLVQRNFSADRPDKLWLADFTYIRTGEEWSYLARRVQSATGSCPGNRGIHATEPTWNSGRFSSSNPTSWSWTGQSPARMIGPMGAKDLRSSLWSDMPTYQESTIEGAGCVLTGVEKTSATVLRAASGPRHECHPHNRWARTRQGTRARFFSTSVTGVMASRRTQDARGPQRCDSDRQTSAWEFGPEQAHLEHHSDMGGTGMSGSAVEDPCSLSRIAKAPGYPSEAVT